MTHQSGPNLTQDQKQVLYATILGGSSLIKPKGGKNCYLAMRDKNQMWLEYKILILKDFFKIDHMVVKPDKTTFRCYSIAYPIFNEVYDTFYNDNKKIIQQEVLEKLTGLAWMVWFFDAGRKHKDKVYLRVQKFGIEGSQRICNYFNSLDTSCELNNNELVFSSQGSIRFLKTMIHSVPVFMMSNLE